MKAALQLEETHNLWDVQTLMWRHSKYEGAQRYNASKGVHYSLAKDPEEKENDEMPGMQFKIMIAGTLSENQENTNRWISEILRKRLTAWMRNIVKGWRPWERIKQRLDWRTQEFKHKIELRASLTDSIRKKKGLLNWKLNLLKHPRS